jgi:hypothetical protein
MFQSYVASVSYDITKVDCDVAYVAIILEACCKRLFKIFHLFFKRMFAIIFYSDVAYVSHMLQEYIIMGSAILALCCSKCFRIASCKCFI